ncbi:hypothetical protein PI125_g20057 [Phytophthora idaei]|nr:hypothetical protein PI125_g20057 [Phytophthora idaei]
MGEVLKDLQWLQQLCVELTWSYSTPLMLGDNMGSIGMTARPRKHSRVKHMENNFPMPRDLVEKKELRAQNVGTNDMVADIMTKTLEATKSERFRVMLKVLPLQELCRTNGSWR